MLKIERIWQTKQKSPSQHARMLGVLGELIFYNVLFLLGIIALGFLLFSFQQRIQHYFLLLAIISFVVIGGRGIIGILSSSKVAGRRLLQIRRVQRTGKTLLGEIQDHLPYVPSHDVYSDSHGTHFQYRLDRVRSDFWSMLAIACFSFTWAGVSVFLLLMCFDSLSDGFWSHWILWACLLSSVAICAWSARYFFVQLKVITSVGPTILEIDTHPLQPGMSFNCMVRQTGMLSVKSLRLYLICEELASYHQGTDVRTEVVEVFNEQVGIEKNFQISLNEAFSMITPIQIPIQAMHSFRSSSNAIQWKLVVLARFKTQPTIRRQFPIIVHPIGAPSQIDVDQGVSGAV